MAPFFTVIIPTFNRYDLACRAVRSVLAQTLHDFELIVVDDHSTNYPLDAFLELADPRLSVVQNQRSKGACGARNTGIALANGQWVSFLDDDDEWLPEKLERQQDLIESPTFGQKVVLIHSGAIVSDGKRNHRQIKKPIDRFPDVKRNLLYQNYVGGMSSVTVRVEAIQAVSGFDERLPSVQDLDLFVRLSEHGAFRLLPAWLTLQHIHHGDRITTSADKKLFATDYLRQKYIKEIRSSFLLRYAFGTRSYRYAMMGRHWGRALKSAPWALAGAVVDRGKFRKSLSTSFRAITHRPPARP